MSESEEGETIVMDNGTMNSKVGFSGDDAPRSVFPSIVGRPKCETIGSCIRSNYVGDDAQVKRGILCIKYPIENGLVTNWDDMEKIWHHSFYSELRRAPEDHNVLVSDAPFTPKANREKTAHIMFETFGVPGLYLQLSSISALYASGRTTGCVLDSGHQSTTVVPIYEGYSMPHTMARSPVGGRDLTEYFMKLLTETGVSFTGACEREIIRDVKERMCYTAENFEEAVRRASITSQCSGVLKTHADVREKKRGQYELPDGNQLNVGHSQRFRCPEALFNLPVLGVEELGIAELLATSISRVDVDVRSSMYENIVLAGGSTMFDGLAERLQFEVLGLARTNGHIFTGGRDSRVAQFSGKVKVVAPPERKYSVWIGGSILTSLTAMQNMWMTKREYDENGPTYVNRKCVA